MVEHVGPIARKYFNHLRFLQNQVDLLNDVYSESLNKYNSTSLGNYTYFAVNCVHEKYIQIRIR